MPKLVMVMVMVAVVMMFDAAPLQAQPLGPHNVVVHIHGPGSSPSNTACDVNTFGSFAAKCPSGSCTSLQFAGANAQGSMIGGPGSANLCVTFDNGNATGGCTPIYFGGQIVGKDPQTIAGFAAVCNINKPTQSVLGGYSNNAQNGEMGSGAVQGTMDNTPTLNAKLSGFEQAP